MVNSKAAAENCGSFLCRITNRKILTVLEGSVKIIERGFDFFFHVA